METIGQRVRRLRISRGYARQSDLGDLVGIKQATLSSIESKNQSFSGEDLMNLSRVLQVTPEHIIYGGEEEDMGTVELLQIYKALPQAEREILMRVARGMKPDLINRKQA